MKATRIVLKINVHHIQQTPDLPGVDYLGAMFRELTGMSNANT
jgi:hypothetical protein